MDLRTRVQRTLPSDARIGVAVSGGADSVCLLHLLRELSPVSLIHVNHQLRGDESEADETFVRALAARFDLPIHVKSINLENHEGNLEENARNARYQFFRELLDAKLVDCVATGHTQSDQAETVLFRLLRGAHLAGLAGIHPRAPGPIIRPLLDVSRAEVEQFLKDTREPWRDDSSNLSLAFDRNRIRHQLLPELKRDWNPELERSLAHLAALAFDEEQFWQNWISQNVHQFLEFRGNIALASASKLTEQPVAVARRLVRRALEHVKGNLHAIDFAHAEAILNLARRPEGNGRLQTPQVDVYRSFDWLRFAPLAVGDQLAMRNQQTTAPVPGRAILAVPGIVVDLEVVENGHVSSLRGAAFESARVREYELDWDRVLKIGKVLCLRTWKPGDQYARPTQSACKLKTMFQDARIPLWERGTWPIITVASQIVWSRVFGPAADVAAHCETRRVLRIIDWVTGEIPGTE